MELYQPQLNFGKNVFEPGVYDLPNEEYHNSVGISRSGVCEFLKTPYHFYDKYTNDRIRSDYESEGAEENEKSLLLGNAVHTYLLEKEDFFNRFYIEAQLDKRNKETKEFAFLFDESVRGKIKLSAKDYSLIKNMSQAVANHEDAPKLIANSVYEKSVYWIDKESGLLCKARPDIWNVKYIADIKTTSCAAESAFKVSIPKYGYHIQAAMIFDALKEAAHEDHSRFIFIAIEKTRPFAIAIYELAEDAIEIGRLIYKNALIAIRDFMEKNIWPSYEYQIIGLPRWAYNTNY